MSLDTVILPQSNEELISEEVREIVSYRPHWFIRRGNAIFLFVLLLMLALTWFIQYPDIVNASARIVAVNPPKTVNARAEGKLVKLFVINEQMVKKEQHLASIESTAQYDEVMGLKKWIEEVTDKISKNEFETLSAHALPHFINLGELQASYQGFQNELIQTLQVLTGGYYQKKKGALQKDLQYLAQLKDNIKQQETLQQEDQKMQLNEFKAYEKLAEEKVIAPLELNQYKSKLIGQHQNIEQLKSQLTSSEASSHNKHKEILEVNKQVSDQQQKFISALFNLKSDAEKWIHQYVVIASEDGKLFFNTPLQENELITTGQSLFYIDPLQTKYYAELFAGQKGFGKIKSGQQVRLKVESYPNTEFGYLDASVNYITNMPNRRDSFLIRVELKKGLETNYSKTIFFRNNLSAQAEIVTENKRLMERFLGQLKEIWKR